MESPIRRDQVALVAVLVLSVCLAAGCGIGADGDQEPAGTSARTGPTSGGSTPGESTSLADGGWLAGLDSRPTLGVAGADGAYVTTAGSVRFAPQVYRLALDDGRELARQTAVGQPNGISLAPDGRVWVVGERHADQAAGTGISVHDPTSLLVVERVELPGSPLSIAAVGDAMWVGLQDRIVVVDPVSLAVLDTVAGSGPAYQLLPAPDGDLIVVGQGRSLQVLDATGATVATRAVPADGNLEGAVTADRVWVRVPVGTASELRAYRLPALDEETVLGELDSTGGGLVASDGQVWAVDEQAAEIACVGAADGAVDRVADETAAGVLTTLPDGRLLLATASGARVAQVECAAS